MDKNQFFSPIGNTKPFAKFGFQGAAGTGKSFTAFQVALGIHKTIGSKKPIVLFDTEKAAKFLEELAKKEGVEVLVRESKTFADLMETMKYMRQGVSDVLVIDSISAVHQDFMESYLRQNSKRFMSIKDWGITKPKWRKDFSEPFVEDSYHIVMCGRVGDKYEMEEDEEGKKTMMKSGVKMRGEAETAYEPDILIQMDRVEETVRGELQAYRTATVLKGRGNLLDGKVIKNPTLADFMPTIQKIIKDPVKNTTVAPKDSAELFENMGMKRNYAKSREVLLEEIMGLLIAAYPGSTPKEKQAKTLFLKETFGAYSWASIQEFDLERLQQGHMRLLSLVEKQLSFEKQHPNKGVMSIAEAERALKEVTAAPEVPQEPGVMEQIFEEPAAKANSKTDGPWDHPEAEHFSSSKNNPIAPVGEDASDFPDGE